MSQIGTVASLWRYPVKSMRGEECAEIFAGFPGVYGDRLFAFRSSSGRPGFPWLTARDRRTMLLYRPRFRHPERSFAPPNLAAAVALRPGATPLYAEPEELLVDVETPSGATFAIDDPALRAELADGLEGAPQISLRRSERALADCRPLSLFAMQTARLLTAEVGGEIDHRRFRANVYLDLAPNEGFAENQLVGRMVRLGETAVAAVVGRDPRCMMITLDPDTAEKTPAVLKAVAQEHAGTAGVYGVMLAEGILRRGDPVEVLDSMPA